MANRIMANKIGEVNSISMYEQTHILGGDKFMLHKYTQNAAESVVTSCFTTSHWKFSALLRRPLKIPYLRNANEARLLKTNYGTCIL